MVKLYYVQELRSSYYYHQRMTHTSTSWNWNNIDEANLNNEKYEQVSPTLTLAAESERNTKTNKQTWSHILQSEISP